MPSIATILNRIHRKYKQSQMAQWNKHRYGCHCKCNCKIVPSSTAPWLTLPLAPFQGQNDGISAAIPAVAAVASAIDVLALETHTKRTQALILCRQQIPSTFQCIDDIGAASFKRNANVLAPPPSSSMSALKNRTEYYINFPIRRFGAFVVK